MTRTKIISRKWINLLESVPPVIKPFQHLYIVCWLVKYLTLKKSSRWIVGGYVVKLNLQVLRAHRTKCYYDSCFSTEGFNHPEQSDTGLNPNAISLL